MSATAYDAGPVLERGTRVGGVYVVEALRSSGGDKSVYALRHSSARWHVASLVVFEATSPAEQEVTPPNHPSFALTTERGLLPDGRNYEIREWVDGVSLASELKTRGALPLGEAMPIFAGVLAAITAAANAGFVIPKIDLDDVVLSPGGVKLLEHGVPWSSLPRLQQAVGMESSAASLELAPELFDKDAQPDERTMIYAVGALALATLTGLRPGDSVNRLASSESRETLGLPAPVRDVLRRATARLPSQRYGTVREFADALGEASAASSSVVSLPMPALSNPVVQTVAEPASARRGIAANDVREVSSPALLVSSSAPVIPGYQILGELGRGGMAVVYKARQSVLRRLVALKVTLADALSSPDDVARFRAEAEAAAGLQHPNIVHVYDFGVYGNGLPYLCLEFVEGETLDHKYRGALLEPREAAKLVETIARAIHYAHEHGVVHRDLKPANVLVSKEGTPKVSDFGIARRMGQDSGLTRTGTILGTPAYMSPEQARGDVRNTGALSDVYGLGAILYAMLTGRAPFSGGAMAETVRRVIEEVPTSPRTLQRSVPVDLETICLRCLEKEPQKRYPNANALAEDLLNFLCDRPIVARPIGVHEALARWCKRNPRVAGLLGVVAFTLATIAIGSTVFAIRLEEARRTAERARAEAVANESAAKDAKALAETNARVAGEQSKLALDTLFSLLTRVESAVRETPGLHDLHEDIVRTAFDSVTKAARTSETSAMADRTSAMAFQKLGILLMQQRGHVTDARDTFQHAVELRERLVAQPEATDEDRLDLVRSYMALIQEEQQLGETRRAVAYAKRAVEAEDAFAARESASALHQAEGRILLALGHRILGDALSESGAFGEAEPTLQRGVALAEEFLRTIGSVPPGAKWRYEPYEHGEEVLSALVDSLGLLAMRQRDYTLAVRQRERSLHVLDEWLRRSPTSVSARRSRAATLYRLGQCKVLLNDAAAAEPLFEQAVESVKGDPQVESEQWRLLAQARLGKVREVANAAAQMRAEARAQGDSPTLWTAAAIYVALDARAHRPASEHTYRDLALATIDEIVASGSIDVSMATSPEFVTIATEPKFVAAIAQMRASLPSER